MISIKNLKKSYGEHVVFNGVSFNIKKSKITAIFGPNGSGKSTLLNIIAGITSLDSGTCNIRIFNEKKFSYVFQDYRSSLLPWKSVQENISLPLLFKRIDKNKRINLVKNLCKKQEFNVPLNVYPYELSGGQQQSVVFLRAIITEPELMLLDEPFSALDYENNVRMRKKLESYFLSKNSTIVIVTHDIEEAVYLADEIIILSNKPTKAVTIITNSLQRPRKTEIISCKEFNEVKEKVMKIFLREVKV